MATQRRIDAAARDDVPIARQKIAIDATDAFRSTPLPMTRRRAYPKDRNVRLGRVASFRAGRLRVKKPGMRCVFLVTAVGFSACALNPVMPDPRTPSDRARELEARCADVPKDVDTEALSVSIVERVDPAYNYVQSGNDRVVRLRGARLRFKARRDLSAESLQLSLECHQARVTLGSAHELENDPYTLPGTWLDIDSRSAGDGYVVAVQVDNIAKARVVLDRARQFVASRQ